jgi:hypothetical protein
MVIVLGLPQDTILSPFNPNVILVTHASKMHLNIFPSDTENGCKAKTGPLLNLK